MSSSTSVTLRTQSGLVAEVDEPSLEDVEGQVHLGMAQMGGVIGRDAARVHRHHRTGLESDDLAARGVVELHHGSSIPVSPNELCALYRMFTVMSTAVKASMAAA